MVAVWKKPLADGRGFTLIEIIAVILVTAVLSVILFQIASNNTTRAYLPLVRTDRSLVVKEVMEQITAEYHHLLATDPLPTLPQLQNWIGGAAFPGGVMVSSYCFSFNQSGPGVWQEPAGHNTTCTAADDVLKITVSLEDQSTTALFCP